MDELTTLEEYEDYFGKDKLKGLIYEAIHQESKSSSAVIQGDDDQYMYCIWDWWEPTDTIIKDETIDEWLNDTDEFGFRKTLEGAARRNYDYASTVNAAMFTLEVYQQNKYLDEPWFIESSSDEELFVSEVLARQLDKLLKAELESIDNLKYSEVNPTDLRDYWRNSIGKEFYFYPRVDEGIYRNINCNLLVATPAELNNDLSTVMEMRDRALPDWTEDDLREQDFDNGLVYVATALGCEPVDYLGLKQTDNVVEQSILSELENAGQWCGCLTTLFNCSIKDYVGLLVAKELSEPVLVGSGGICGLVEPTTGAGGPLEIELNKPVIVPGEYIYDIEVEGRDERGSRLCVSQHDLVSVDEIYQLSPEAWKWGKVTPCSRFEQSLVDSTDSGDSHSKELVLFSEQRNVYGEEQMRPIARLQVPHPETLEIDTSDASITPVQLYLDCLEQDIKSKVTKTLEFVNDKPTQSLLSELESVKQAMREPSHTMHNLSAEKERE